MTVMLLIGYHMVVGPTCRGAGDSGSIGVADNDCDVADTVSYGGWLGLPVEVLVTVGGSIGVADNDCGVADKVSYGGWTYLWMCW